MVGSRKVKVIDVKNMVLTTFGMNGEGNVIWYPSLYDADSCLGLIASPSKILSNWLGNPEEDDRGEDLILNIWHLI